MTAQAPAAPAREVLAGRAHGWALFVAGALGAAAAAVLLIERFALATNPLYVPSCSVNAVLSCGTVMTSEQATVFGFPNPVLGLATFPVVAAAGAAVLAGGRLRAWFWWSLLAGSTLGTVFVHWLVAQSIWSIGALCPYCLAVWVCTVTAFVTVLAVLATNGRAPRAVATWAPSVVVGWVAVVAVTATTVLAGRGGVGAG